MMAGAFWLTRGLTMKMATTMPKIARATTPNGLIGQPLSVFSIGPRFSSIDAKRY